MSPQVSSAIFYKLSTCYHSCLISTLILVLDSFSEIYKVNYRPTDEISSGLLPKSMTEQGAANILVASRSLISPCNFFCCYLGVHNFIVKTFLAITLVLFVVYKNKYV